jgi:DNA-binding transcriptional ArsR family regulator
MQGFSALGDPTRQRIVEILAGGPLRAGQIASRFDVSPPAISQHLKALRKANLVRVRRDAQRRIYELNPEGVRELADWIARIRGFWPQKLDALESAVRNDDRENKA